MPNFEEKGFSPIIIIIIVLIGLAVTSFLVFRPAIYRSKADEGKISVNIRNEDSSSAKAIESTAPALPKPSPIVLTTPDPVIKIISSPSPKPTPANTPAPTSAPTLKPLATAIPTTTATPQPTQTPAQSDKPQLSLSPSTDTFNKNCNISLNIELNTAGNKTDGTDTILFFDASKFTVTSVTVGTLYENYPNPFYDNQTGKIIVSAFPSFGNFYSGKGTFARINFTVKSEAQTGNTQIKFDFDPNYKSKTTDSNMIKTGTSEEILDSVIDGNYTIGSGSC